ncbi:hypothetical protein SLEP1_g59174 [Rubroshorea leprosula]|uniref:Disease resistance R13L4/SHOC-2-like LRR domain-containing protein n=1 Tax=Rubroshorea leprosula TaxID=152421 RepID=A0AAV5MRI8_9ROSI|nr:hypothetical protein SLEP1_g59174 [Rubroshorea leprosula]
MTSSSSVLTASIVATVVWIIFLAVPSIMLVAADSQDSEARALLESGWWNGHVNDTANHCRWPGVKCNHDGSVIEISLPDSYYYDEGEIVTRMNFSAFPNLLRLDLNNKGFSGSIPPGLGHLTKLRNLSLGSNQLSGSIPPEIGKLHNLVALDLSGNLLSGSIPQEFGDMKNLSFLRMNYNQLNGSLPPTLCLLSKLKYLNLRQNKISGSIPSEIGNMKSLIYLNMVQNQILVPSIMLVAADSQDLEAQALLESGWWSGHVDNIANHCSWPGVKCNHDGSVIEISPPYSYYSYEEEIFTKMNFSAFPNLLRLDLNDRGFSGSIPPGLGHLSKLRKLSLGGNQLNGSIPPEIGKLHNLVTLDLSYNSLSGSIPQEFGDMKNLSFLCIDKNQLSGPLPPTLGLLSKLKHLNL